MIDINPVAVLAAVAFTVVLSVCVHRRLIKPLRAENERLMELIADPVALDVHLANRQIEFRGQHLAARWLAASFKDSLASTANCIEMTVGTPEHGFYLVTVCRRFGKTPLDLLAEAERVLRAVINEVTYFKIPEFPACIEAKEFLARSKTIEEVVA